MPVIRRLPLSRPERSTHAGLWLDRFFDEREGPEGAAARHIKALAGHAVPAGYPEAFDLRRRDLEERGVPCCEASAAGRLIIGLGQKGPIEAGLHLEHTWGVPLLPGPALKGLAAATAHQLLDHDDWRRGGESHAALFGETDDAGQVIFHDAWWIPEGDLPIHLDVMTVHHPKYYASGRATPSDMDSPNPVAFAAVTGRYLVAVEGEADLCDAALSILKIGLMELGIGAKTNAGYGRLRLSYEPAAERAARIAAQEAERAERARKEQARYEQEMDGMIARMKPETAAGLIDEGLRRYTGPAARRFAQRAIEKLTPGYLRKKQDKAWVVKLLKAAEGDGP